MYMLRVAGVVVVVAAVVVLPQRRMKYIYVTVTRPKAAIDHTLRQGRRLTHRTTAPVVHYIPIVPCSQGVAVPRCKAKRWNVAVYSSVTHFKICVSIVKSATKQNQPGIKIFIILPCLFPPHVIVVSHSRSLSFFSCSHRLIFKVLLPCHANFDYSGTTTS